MRKLGLVIAALALAGLVSSGAWAQSAKFAADWAANRVVLAEIKVDEATAETPVAEELMTTIKVPQGKELLIGVSGVANLVTFTAVKGKNKEGEITSSVEATMDLEVRFAPVGTANVCLNGLGTLAVPGAITFASRIQTLSVETDLVVTGGETITGFVSVALELDTTTAHHFNFLGVDLDSGEYDVYACFTGEALRTLSDATLAKGSALVAIAHRIVTVQEVRAVRGSIDTLTQCNDGIDNDDNGKIDFPDDAGCTSALDTTEAP